MVWEIYSPVPIFIERLSIVIQKHWVWNPRRIKRPAVLTQFSTVDYKTPKITSVIIWAKNSQVPPRSSGQIRHAHLEDLPGLFPIQDHKTEWQVKFVGDFGRSWREVWRDLRVGEGDVFCRGVSPDSADTNWLIYLEVLHYRFAVLESYVD